MNDNHDVIVKIGLTADQFVTFHADAQNLGLSDSACGRMVILKFIRANAMTKLSANSDMDRSTETVLIEDNK